MVSVKEENKHVKNMLEQISDVRVARVLEEEEQLAKSNEDIRKIKADTIELVSFMEAARDKEDEELRRKFRNDVVVLNLRLVTQVLMKYGAFSQDKFQNGCVGLLKAAETFNSQKGVPFHNYACFCIETEIRLAFKKSQNKFEAKSRGFLDSLDAPASLANGDSLDKHEMIYDPFAEQEFDAIIEEAETDTLFYDIIIPCIDLYGTRAKDIDMVLWRELEIQYFIELSMEQSQRQRITFSEMAKQLKTTPQNLRTRHKKVIELVKKECRAFGYDIQISASGRARMVKDFDNATKHGK